MNMTHNNKDTSTCSSGFTFLLWSKSSETHHGCHFWIRLIFVFIVFFFPFPLSLLSLLPSVLLEFLFLSTLSLIIINHQLFILTSSWSSFMRSSKSKQVCTSIYTLSLPLPLTILFLCFCFFILYNRKPFLYLFKCWFLHFHWHAHIPLIC